MLEAVSALSQALALEPGLVQARALEPGLVQARALRLEPEVV